MKKMLLIIIISTFLLLGCDKNMTARDAVKDYLEMYITLDDEVIKQIDEMVDKSEYTNEQKDKYKEVLEREYTNISYNILNETYDEDVAYVNVNVQVLDYYKVQRDVNNYFNEHKDEFNDSKGDYDKGKFFDYKLEQMMNTKDITNYEIEFKVIKDGNKWSVAQLSNEALEKLHGIYNYEE